MLNKKLTRRHFLAVSFFLFAYSEKLLANKILPLLTFKFDLASHESNGYVLWDFDSGMSNFQYHAFDELKREMYTLQHSAFNRNGGKICRFSMDFFGKINLIDWQDYDPRVGHQMLSIENLDNGNSKVWVAKGPMESLSVLRFSYSSSKGPLFIEEFQLFDPSDFGDFFITGCLSYDQSMLIVRGRSRESSRFKGKNCIAIFDVKMLLKNGPGKAWHLVSKIWTYDHYSFDNKIYTNVNPQSIVSDGSYVYLIFGPLDINVPNYIRQYTLDGVLIYQTPELKIGYHIAKKLSKGVANEFEGAQFLRLSPSASPVLTIGYVKGGPKYYKGVYVLNP